jgi:TonB family protein
MRAVPNSLRCALALCALASTLAQGADADAEKQQSLLRLRAAITKHITTPCGVKPERRLAMKLVLQDNGYVQGMGIVQSSGAAAFDAAVMTAIARAQPFKLPADAAARKELQNLNMNFDAFAAPLPKCREKK